MVLGTNLEPIKNLKSKLLFSFFLSFKVFKKTFLSVKFEMLRYVLLGLFAMLATASALDCISCANCKGDSSQHMVTCASTAVACAKIEWHWTDYHVIRQCSSDCKDSFGGLTTVSCCDTNNCNAASSMAASVGVLVAALFVRL